MLGLKRSSNRGQCKDQIMYRNRHKQSLTLLISSYKQVEKMGKGNKITMKRKKNHSLSKLKKLETKWELSLKMHFKS
jgi:hypothetical protein